MKSPVLVISTFGAIKNYPNQDIMRETLTLFLNSLLRQTDPDWQLFISCHDIPRWVPTDERIRWCSISPNGSNEGSLVPVLMSFRESRQKIPAKLSDPIEYEREDYHSKMMDMGRKTFNSAINAGHWAYWKGLKEFWMLRMDSDDLLAKDHVHIIHELESIGFDAVFNRTCHIFDIRSREMGIYAYRFPTTCNALRMKPEGDELPNWFYLCTDHTIFNRHLNKDHIPWKEVDSAMCITCNSGNTISGRGQIQENKEADITPIELTEELIERYGLPNV